MHFLILIFAFLMLSLPAHAADRNLLVFGDSLSAGYGIRVDQAWPSLLQQRLVAKGSDYKVVNLSISGETTAGGRSRLGAALKQHKPKLLVLVLGANDGLRGLPIRQMQENLEAMIAASRASGAQVVLVGMRLPPNYGPYANQFGASFAEIAKKQKLPLVDFLLAGIADKPALFQADMLHPTAEAQPLILDTVWAGLAPLLK